MKLYIRQKVFSWKDKFTVKDFDGRDVYQVEGEFFSFGKKLHIYDMSGNEVAFIQQKVLSFLPRYYVYVGDNQVAEILKKFTFLRPKYEVHGLNWQVEGDFLGWDYRIFSNDGDIAKVTKQLFKLTDTYLIDVKDHNNALDALMLVLAIDVEECTRNRD